MDTPFTHTTHPPGRWLATLASSLVLWGIAYAQAPAPDASPADYGATSLLSTGTERGRLQRWLLNDLDNAAALHQLAEPSREQSPRMVAANTGPNARLAEPK